MGQTTRIATVKATGERFVVQQVTFGEKGAPSKVHCWGQLVAYTVRGGVIRKQQHEGTKTFLLEAVDLKEVPRDATLLEALFQQSKKQINEGKMPGYLTDAQAREQAARLRALKSQADYAFKSAVNHGDFEPLHALLNRVAPAK